MASVESSCSAASFLLIPEKEILIVQETFSSPLTKDEVLRVRTPLE